jgi:hypothetical protein
LTLEETAMPGGGPLIRPSDTVETLWFGLLIEPWFGGLFVAVTFAGRSDGPEWQLWALRAFLVLFFGSVGSLTAVLIFREFRRRGYWVPPGVARHPWLAPAAYVAAIIPIFAAVITGFVRSVELYGRWLEGW